MRSSLQREEVRAALGGFGRREEKRHAPLSWLNPTKRSSFCCSRLRFMADMALAEEGREEGRKTRE